MKNLLLAFLTFLSLSTFGQDKGNTIERKGFVLGVDIGGWVISIADSNDEGRFDEAQFGVYALDLQTTLQMGRAYLDNDQHRGAVTFTIRLGFNWD